MRVLDTDTCVAILRGHDAVLERRASVADDVATTWITACELFYGAARSARPQANRDLVVRFLDTLPLLGLDLSAAQLFGEIKALLERKGTRLADADLLIAAITVSRDAVLVTGNRRHYERVPGVSLEDWMHG